MFLVKNMLEYMDNLGKQTMLAIRSQSFTKCNLGNMDRPQALLQIQMSLDHGVPLLLDMVRTVSSQSQC